MTSRMAAHMFEAAGLPAGVAEAGAFPPSDRASFVTGAVIPADGGRSAKLA